MIIVRMRERERYTSEHIETGWWDASGYLLYARLAQLVRAPALQAGGHRFESCTAHQAKYAIQASGMLGGRAPEKSTTPGE